ncbi:MAG: DUF3857 domain-containing protein, partial [Vicinamibacterales bacterium]
MVSHWRPFVVGLIASLTYAAPAAAADLPPLTPAELAMKAPVIEKDADAEALIWDVRITDSTEHDLATILEYSARVKIFTDRGRETHGTIELSYTNTRRVRDVEGRTIAPTGAVTELKQQDIFDRNI